MSKKVFIGAGHGGSDPGAVANGFQEKDLNLSIAIACYETLVRHGVNVKISRLKDEDDPYSVTIQECNAFAPDVAVEIHNNAGGGDGVEVYHSKRDSADDALAKNILDAIVAIGQNSRGLKTKELSNGSAYFAWIRNINAPAVLVECAFMDSKDIQIIDTPAEQKSMGIAIAKGILKTLGIAYKEPAAQAQVEGNIVYFRGGKHYTSANGNNGKEVKAGPAKITNYVKGAKHPYHVIHTDKSSNVYGWVNEDRIETSSVVRTPQVGEVVTFAGGRHYVGSNSDTGYNAKGGAAKVTNYVKGAKHPYHLVRVPGGSSTVYGWVDANTIK